jgi:hypothetical protein
VIERPSAPWVEVTAAQSTWRVAGNFMMEGVRHILFGADHLLFVFGLLHGFGFASALTSSGLPRSEVPVALLCFNLGVEAGQLAFVLVVLMLARAFRILPIRWPRAVQLLPGYAVGTMGAFWLIQRTLVMLRALS